MLDPGGGGPYNDRMRGIIARNAEATGRTTKEIEEEFLQDISIRSKIEPDEIADMVIFLASDATRHVSGRLIDVCGDIEWEI